MNIEVTKEFTSGNLKGMIIVDGSYDYIPKLGHYKSTESNYKILKIVIS